MSRQHFKDTLKYAKAVGFCGAKAEYLAQAPGVNTRLKARILKQSLNFRTKNQRVIQNCVEQRLDAQAIPCQKQALILVVPKGKSKNAVHLLDKIHPKRHAAG